jgi:glycosyltransferase involved in cell wall biosynthesis
MKLLFIIDGLRSGGKERRLVSLLNRLVQTTGFTCELIILNIDIHYTEIEDLGIKIHKIERKAAKDIRPFLTIYTICNRFNPDIIHVWDNLSTLFSIPSVLLKRKKLISSRISHAPQNYKKFSFFGLQAEIGFFLSTKILSNSHAGLAAYNQPSIKKSKVIHNGFNFNRVENLTSKEIIRNKFSVSENIIIGMVSSFTIHKDYNTFLKVAREIRSERNDVAFICVGDGPLRAQLQEEYGKQNGIYFLGRQKNVESIVKIFDIGVLSTITEGISNTIMEYMALAKPVVATDGGGTNELVINNETGYLTDAYDAKSMKHHLIQLIENPSLAVKIGTNGRIRLEEHFSMDKMFNEFIKTYQETI